MKKNKAQILRCEAGPPQRAGEQGFMLLGLMVAIAIILLILGVAASKAAFSLHRDREVESARRANQYVRAIRKFYLKNGNRYPGSIEQLENTNRIRYLRQRYVDPLTGKADYRLIPVGQNKTTPKGFFGEPLAGLVTTGLGSVAGMQSPGIGGQTTALGTPGGAGALGRPGSSATNGAGVTTSPTDPGSAGAAGNSLGGASGLATQIGTGLPGSIGPFMGVGSSASGPSILAVNEQTSYDTWEFLYDPRIEKLKAAAALNAGPGSVGAGSLGTTPGSFGSPNGSTSNPLGSSGGATPNGGTPPTKP
jgi:type II secretory pathway pseudopilin PulG